MVSMCNLAKVAMLANDLSLSTDSTERSNGLMEERLPYIINGCQFESRQDRFFSCTFLLEFFLDPVLYTYLTTAHLIVIWLFGYLHFHTNVVVTANLLIQYTFRSGSFVVVDTQNLSDIIGFHHRKEEISDVKFSPRE